MNYKLENVGDKLNSEQCSSVMVHEFCVGTVPAAGADLEAPRKYRNSYLLQIQGDSGGICNTLGNYSMCDSKQKIHMDMGPQPQCTSALRLVAASLNICYEMCQTSMSQGFVHCRSSVTQW